jgi:hypothetical protein
MNYKAGDEVLITVYPHNAPSFTERGVVLEASYNRWGEIYVKNYRGNYLKASMGNHNSLTRQGAFYDGRYTIEPLPTSLQFILDCDK